MRKKRRAGEVRDMVLAFAEGLDFADPSEPDDAERESARREQVDKGHVNVVPLPRLATQPFRTELTVERNSLFVSSTYKGDYFVRESLAHHPDSNEPVVRRVTVGRTGRRGRARGVLTQAHQDAFYQLLRFWGDCGNPVAEVDGAPHGIITVSGYELVTSLCGGDDSSKAYQRVRDLVRDLSAIPVLLENEYSWQKVCDREEFTLLERVYWRERRVEQATGRPSRKGRSEVRIHLSPNVTTGFLDQNIKVLLGGPYQALRHQGQRKGEIACLLYPWLDLQLSRKESYSAKLSGLIERFALAPCRYKSKRKEKFAHAISALNGQLIQQGKFKLRLSLRLAADEQDFVLVARRVAVG